MILHSQHMRLNTFYEFQISRESYQVFVREAALADGRFEPIVGQNLGARDSVNNEESFLQLGDSWAIIAVGENTLILHQLPGAFNMQKDGVDYQNLIAKFQIVIGVDDFGSETINVELVDEYGEKIKTRGETADAKQNTESVP